MKTLKLSPIDIQGKYDLKIDIKKSLPRERHCKSCASWGDCPCGNKKCKGKEEDFNSSV